MENKTVVYEGNVYEIGAPYLFSVLGKSWTHGILTDIDRSYKKPFCTNNHEWLYIKEIPSGTNGTITPAPLKLIHGNAYTFECDGRKVGRVGVYDEPSSRFYSPVAHVLASACTNIREMTVKETK